MNDEDEAVGAWQGPAAFATFIYDNGVVSFLPGIYNTIQALDINNRNEIVGSLLPFNGGFSHAFLYSNGRFLDLGTLGTGGSSVATGINNSGQIIGVATTALGSSRGFLYRNGRMQDIGAFFPFKINDHGQVVGSSFATNPHAILYAAGLLRVLGRSPAQTSVLRMRSITERKS